MNRHDLRSKWVQWSLAVLVGAALGVCLNYYIELDNKVAGCIRNSEQKVLNARAWEVAASVRLRDGDLNVAEKYTNTAAQLRNTIPLRPEDFDTRGDDPAARRDGCYAAYPPPIPFVE